MKLGGGGELDLVAAWGEGLDHCVPGPGRGGRHRSVGRRPFDPAHSVWTEISLSCTNSVWTQFGLARANSVQTQFGLVRGRLRPDAVRLARANSVRTQWVIN